MSERAKGSQIEVEGQTLPEKLSDLQADINSKANAVAMAQALALKADADAVAQALALKADNSAVSLALADKADKTQLNGLATETFVSQAVSGLATDASVAGKADKTYVDTELGKKADSAAVSQALELKADASQLESKADASALAQLRSDAVLESELTGETGNSTTKVMSQKGVTDAIRESGGGASALADLTDVDFGTPSDGQVLTYDAATQKSKFTNPAGGGGVNVVQSTGQSTTDVMSQKAVTDSLVLASSIIEISENDYFSLLDPSSYVSDYQFLLNLPEISSFMMWSSNVTANGYPTLQVSSVGDFGMGDSSRFFTVTAPVYEGAIYPLKVLGLDSNGTIIEDSEWEGTPLPSLYANQTDITSSVLSGVPFYKLHNSEVASGSYFAGTVSCMFEVDPNTAYYAKGTGGQEFSGTSGSSTERFSFLLPLQSHSSSSIVIEWTGCTLISAIETYPRV